jgi:hypothetical protein
MTNGTHTGTHPGPRIRAQKTIRFVTNATDALVYLALESFADDTGVCWPSQVTLAERAKLDIRNVQRALTRLRSSGLVTSVQRVRNGAIIGCTYTLTPYLPVTNATETAETVEDVPQEPPALAVPAEASLPSVPAEPVEVVRPALPHAAVPLPTAPHPVETDGPLSRVLSALSLDVRAATPALRSVLGERLSAGWDPDALAAAMLRGPLPDDVRSVSGLLAHRATDLPTAPPSAVRSAPVRSECPVPGHEGHPAGRCPLCERESTRAPDGIRAMVDAARTAGSVA